MASRSKKKKRNKCESPKIIDELATSASTSDVARYLVEYVHCYRSEYERFTARPPNGPGYPKLAISPYMEGVLDCYLAHDGTVVCLFGPEDDSVSYLSTPEIARSTALEIPVRRGGISTTRSDLAHEVLDGRIPPPLEASRITSDIPADIRVLRFDMNLNELLSYLTLGVMHSEAGPPDETYFWLPSIHRNVWFTSFTGRERYFRYFELSHHVDRSAWDFRAALIRAHADVRRDFAFAITHPEASGTLSSPQLPPVIAEKLIDALSPLKEAIDGFTCLLDDHNVDVEEKFHAYLVSHPILLDVYAVAVSKPRFLYPDGALPSDKTYVEPDFILQYPGLRYKLVEIERPLLALERKDGGGRAGLSHAAFQIAEWQDFIANYPEAVKTKFPGLVSGRYTTTIVIGRRNEIGSSDYTDNIRRIATLERQYGCDEVMTYDDLLDRCKAALTQLQSLAYYL
jgi:hypothetical protein